MTKPNPSGAGADPGVPHLDYRKKPVVIQAVKYIGGGNVEPRGAVPDWLWEALASGTAYYTNGSDPLRLKTLEGPLIVSPGDWIIRGVKGELYPCKPDIFAATYEPAAAARLVGSPEEPKTNENVQLPDVRRTVERGQVSELRVEGTAAEVTTPYDLNTGHIVTCSCVTITGGARALNTTCPVHGTQYLQGPVGGARGEADARTRDAGSPQSTDTPKAEVAPGDGRAARLQDGHELIASERLRQRDQEGWTANHDDTHERAEMVAAACCYAALARRQVDGAINSPAARIKAPSGWPWHAAWWKPSGDPLRNLVKAGALIAAEIDRLQRRALTIGDQPEGQ